MTSTPFNREPLRVEDGISRFSESDFYWSLTIPRENLRSLVSHLRTKPLLEACREAGVAANYIGNYHRSDFIYSLPYRDDGTFRALDLGSGFGNVTIPLAKRMDKAEVYAVDGSLDILKLLKARAVQEGCENITAVQTDNFESMNLPFAPGSFDLVVMNGLLEWIGDAVPSGDPREWQERFLAYIHTLLRPGGCIYIGIEARYFLGYFTGIRDPHSQLRFTSVVPRKIADRIARRAGKPNGYRTYTHSHAGYRSLLQDAGFKDANVETLYSVASYKDPYFIFSFRDRHAYRYAFTACARMLFPSFRGRFAYRVFYLLGLESFFAPGFLFLARKEGAAPERSLLVHHAEPLLAQLGHAFEGCEVLKIDGNKADDSCVNFFLFMPGASKPAYFLKVKRVGEFSDAHRKAIEMVAAGNDANVILPLATSATAELYAFVGMRPLPSTWNSVQETLTFLKAFHGTPTAGERAIEAVGLHHGDFTIENLGSTNQGLALFDLEHLTTQGRKNDDLCSLVLHYYAYARSLTVQEIAAALMSDETVALFQKYDETVTRTEMHELLRDFISREADRFSADREAKAARYRALLEALANETDTPLKV